ncbi:MAG: carnitine 3-dehydrogenase [Rhodospirillales bacterium]|jgi:carnitine 3-dehydrogenase|nr:carnitine 3-dehydrogenase [Rhodospirillales bacterium]
MSEIKTVGIVGAGVIGAGWAARALARGYDVIGWDPGPNAGEILRAKIENAWPALVKIGWAKTATPPAIRFTTDIKELAEAADFIQESAPENIELKRKLHADLDAHASADMIFASSSSGLLPSEIQADCKHPERVMIGHPFNPVYLLPLCELVGGAKTSKGTIERADAFYKTLGMHTLHVRKEVEAYLSDRLQEAMWREGMHIINEGIATPGELDASIVYGFGLRLAFMGQYKTFHLAGGNQGMRHFMKQFGPALKLPWTKLEAPDLTDELIDKIVDGCEAEAGDSTVEEWELLRDDCLIGIMQTLRQFNIASGKTLADDEATQLGKQEHTSWREGDDVAAPLALYSSAVQPNWIDYNGHMTEASYLEAFGWGSDALFRYVGIDEDYRANGNSFYTVESHINYFQEVGTGEPLRFTTQILGLDEKRMHIFHSMYHGQSGDLLATTEQMLLHVDMNAQRACPILPDVYKALQAVMASHEDMARPEQVGHQMQIKS